jgi:alpha-glucosidase (family GH31 glycosyl hydrolase)
LVKQFTIGGIVEIFTWARETAIETIKVLHYIVGKPALPTFWALGWHQSRWGYRNTSHYEYVVDNYLRHEIPVDTLWADIDYMYKYEDFTLDRENFEKLPSIVENIKKDHGIHFVPHFRYGYP